MWRLLALVFLFAAGGLFSHGFAQTTGDTRYNSGVIQYYDGSSWKSTSTVTTAGSCTTAGQIRYSSSRLEFCNGSNWISMDQGVNRGSCSSAGLSRSNSNELQFCNGSQWRAASQLDPCPLTGGGSQPHGTTTYLATTSGPTANDCSECGFRSCTCNDGSWSCAGGGYYMACSSYCGTANLNFCPAGPASSCGGGF